jgi:hypothetical protein
MMPYPRNPEQPTRPNLPEDELRDPTRLDDELQFDPELAEGPASSGRIAMYAVAIAVILGAVFYGLNNSSINRAGTSSTAQNTAPPAAQNNAPATAPATPPGTTTGAAPARPQMPPIASPPGSTVNPPTGTPPAGK